MKTFNDNAGRTWTVDVNIDAVKRVKDLAGVDFMELVEGGGLFERLVRNPIILCDVLYAVCKTEADAKGLTDEDFGRAMLANANRDRKKKPTLFKPADFNPYAEREKRNVAIKVNDIGILKRVFVDNRVSRVAEKT